MVDTWIMVQDQEINGTRTRSFNIMKSRGMPHSAVVKEFAITSKGVKLKQVINRNNNKITDALKNGTHESKLFSTND
jgi:circadian clock protein KaiC